MERKQVIIKPNRFVGLHNHDCYSQGDGYGQPSEHVDFVLKNGGDGLAITNHGNGNSLAHFYLYQKQLKKKGIKFRPLYGVEFYFVPSLKEWRIDYEANRAKLAAAKSEEEAKKKKKQLSLGDIDAEKDVIGLVEQITPAEDDVGTGATVEDENESKSVKFMLDDSWKRRYHLVINAKNSVGLSNLFTLVKKSYKDGFFKFPRIDFEMLKLHGEGLVVSTACASGPLSSTVIRGTALERPSTDIMCDLENYTDRFVDAVGLDNFFLELQFNKLEFQHNINKYLFQLVNKTGIKLISTADAHYPSPDKWEARELYRMVSRPQWMKAKDAKEEQKSRLPTFEELKCELYPKNADQMWEEYQKSKLQYPNIYRDTDQLVADSIDRTHDIAWQMCEDVQFDESPKLPNFSTPEKSAYDQLVEIVEARMKQDGYWDKQEYRDRLKEELSVIKDKGFENYFLIMYKIFALADKEGLLGPGRGSSTGYLTNFMLGITQVDPIKYGLSGARFITRSRVGYPDIDTDISDREILINCAKRLFGEESVIPVSNFNTFKVKSLIKNVAKFYDIDYEEVNALTGPLQWEVEPLDRGDDVEKSIYVLTHDACMKHSQKYRDFMAKYPKVQEHMNNLFMHNFSIGRHAGGVLVCPNLEKHIPLISVKGDLQTPWTEGMQWRTLEVLGFLKFDFLGLSLLKMVEDCIRRILQKQGMTNPQFSDIKKWFDEHLNVRYHEPNDPKVYQYVFREKRFTGCFQFTQNGARNFCAEVNPTNIVDLAAVTAIYRPGPLKADVHKKYVAAEFDLPPIVYKHPVIREVLEPTRGFCVFQETFMVMAQKLAGFTDGEADGMRKTLVKKSLDAAAKKGGERVILREKFVEGARRLHNVDESISNELFDSIENFAQYGFSKNHALPYVVDSYYAAWLHTYHEKEWLATCLQTEMGNSDNMSKTISEIKQLQYKFMPHDINRSDPVSWIYDDTLEAFIPPLSSIKGIGSTAAAEIRDNRPYHSVDDLLYDAAGQWKHSKLTVAGIQNMCRVGALSSLNEFKGGNNQPKRSITHQRQLEWMIDNRGQLLKKGRYGMTPTALKKLEKQGLSPVHVVDRIYFDEAECRELPDWNRQEKIILAYELTSAADDSLMFPPQILAKLEKARVLPLSELPHAAKGICWFFAKDVEVKLTAKKKSYLRITAIDNTSKVVKLKVWGAKHPIDPYSLWMCTAKGDDQWGPSTNMADMRRIEVKS